MSLVQNSNLYENALGKALEFYKIVILPRITQKNKRTAISLAIALAFGYYIRDRFFKPPRNIRHIPYRGYYHLIKSLVIDKDSFFDRGYKYDVPFLNTPGNPELYCELGGIGWEIHINNSEDAKRVFLKHEIYRKISVVERNEYTLLNKFVSGPNIFSSAGPEWKQQRKVVNPAFRCAMPVKLFGKLGKDLFKVMETMGETIEINTLLLRWTLDAISKAGFGFDFHATTDINSKWVVLYNEIAEGMRDPLYVFFPVLEYPSLLWFNPKRRALHKKLDIFLEMLDEVIVRKRQLVDHGNLKNDDLEENEKDILTLMIEAEKRGEGAMTNAEVKSNLCFFFFAGHETTSNALSFTLYHLATHPARQEAINILGDAPEDVVATLEDTKQMTYINQIIKESLRLSDPAPGIFPRRVTEDSVFSGVFVPKGSMVSVNIFNIHHREKYWKNADQFNPDRFAENGEGNSREAGDNMAWIPFASGARQCLGMNFSLVEQRVILSLLLRKFTWSHPENSKHKNGLITGGGFPIVQPVDMELTFKRRY